MAFAERVEKIKAEKVRQAERNSSIASCKELLKGSW